MGLEQIAVAFFISSLLMLCAFLFSKFIDFIGGDEIGYFVYEWNGVKLLVSTRNLHIILWRDR